MGGAFGNIEDLGALIIWLFKGFKGTFKDCKKGYNAFYLGVGLILLFIMVLVNW